MRYDKINYSIIFATKILTKNGKEIRLTATVKMEDSLFNEVKDHLLSTNMKISQNQIAVLENWYITSKYNVECRLSSKKNIIYKF